MNKKQLGPMANINETLRQETAKLIPQVIEQLQDELTKPSNSGRERLAAADKILDLAGSITVKDQTGHVQGMVQGFQISSDMFKGVINTLGEIYDVDLGKVPDIKEETVVSPEVLEEEINSFEIIDEVEEEVKLGNKINYEDV